MSGDDAAAAASFPGFFRERRNHLVPRTPRSRNRNDLSVCPGEPGRSPIGERGDAFLQLAGADGEAAVSRWYRETIATGELPEGVSAFTERRSPGFLWAD